MKAQTLFAMLCFCTQFAIAQDTGVIVAGEGSCKKSDRIVIETRRGFTLAETYRGDFRKGEKIFGDLNRYGFRDVETNGRSGRIYVDNWGEGLDSAQMWCSEN